MKKAIVLVIALMMLCPSAFAISLADSYKVASVGSNTHAHASVATSSKVYALTVTAPTSMIASSLYGIVGLYQTNSIAVQQNTDSVIGMHYLKTATPLVHVKVSSTQPTVHLSWADGIACGGRLFVDCQHARADVYYRD